MNNMQCKEFLVWLINRLKNKHNEDVEVIQKIAYIIQNKRIIDERIDIKFINALCNKHYPGYHFEKADVPNIGYCDQEKKEIYELISSIVLDTVNAQQ